MNASGVVSGLEVLEKGDYRDRTSTAERSVLYLDSNFLGHVAQLISHIIFVSFRRFQLSVLAVINGICEESFTVLSTVGPSISNEAMAFFDFVEIGFYRLSRPFAAFDLPFAT